MPCQRVSDSSMLRGLQVETQAHTIRESRAPHRLYQADLKEKFPHSQSPSTALEVCNEHPCK